MTFKPKTEFDRQRFEARIGALHGPGNIKESHWSLNNGWNNHDDGSVYETRMIAEGYWKRCEACGKAFNPKYEHECSLVEVEKCQPGR